MGVGSAEEHARESAPPSLWHFRHVAPVKPGQAPTMHDPRRFCPSWELSLNDRAQFSEVPREWVARSVLPRDRKWMELASPSELQDMYYTAQAQVSPFSAYAPWVYVLSLDEMLMFTFLSLGPCRRCRPGEPLLRTVSRPRESTKEESGSRVEACPGP